MADSRRPPDVTSWLMAKGLGQCVDRIVHALAYGLADRIDTAWAGVGGAKTKEYADRMDQDEIMCVTQKLTQVPTGADSDIYGDKRRFAEWVSSAADSAPEGELALRIALLIKPIECGLAVHSCISCARRVSVVFPSLAS